MAGPEDPGFDTLEFRIAWCFICFSVGQARPFFSFVSVLALLTREVSRAEFESSASVAIGDIRDADEWSVQMGLDPP